MGAPQLYVLFPGTAREALNYYARVFGDELELHDYAQFNRDDGPPTAIAHGMLSGPVTLGGADAAPDQSPVQIRGAMLSLLGAEEPKVLRGWFQALAEGGRVIDPLAAKPWGAVDGQVIDRYGLTWLIGYE